VPRGVVFAASVHSGMAEYVDVDHFVRHVFKKRMEYSTIGLAYHNPKLALVIKMTASHVPFGLANVKFNIVCVWQVPTAEWLAFV
jgi:hypothetical protein